MKKSIIKITVFIAVFLLALIVIGRIMNEGHDNLTVEMGPATLPLVTMELDGIDGCGRLPVLRLYIPVGFCVGVAATQTDTLDSALQLPDHIPKRYRPPSPPGWRLQACP